MVNNDKTKEPKFASQICMSSNRNNWATPQAFFDSLNVEFRFSVDVCASDWNHKMDRFWTIQDDSLSLDWSAERCFMNPPYGREIGKWVKKAREESLKGALVIGLIPARTDTRYWHTHVWDAQNEKPREGVKVRFLKGRLKFSGYNAKGEWCEKAPATFPSAVVIWYVPK